MILGWHGFKKFKKIKLMKNGFKKPKKIIKRTTK